MKDSAEVKEVNCELCGSSETVEVPHCRQYTNNQPIHICKKCGLVYFKYRRSPDEMAKHWEHVMFKTGEYTSHNPVFKSRHIFALEFIKESIGVKDKVIVDIGAGEGQFLDYCRKEGAKKVFGIESAKMNSELLKVLNIDHFHGTIEAYTKAEISRDVFSPYADIVTIMWTLHASQSCVDMLTAAYDMLKDDGYVFIQMGSRVLVPFKKPLGTYFSTVLQDDTPYHFSINTLEGMLAKCNFKITNTNHYWDNDLLNILAQKRPKNENIEWQPDDYREVEDYFERWHNESERMKKYVRILPLDYKLTKIHTFYDK
ncbi:MAG: methyltransferase domain-containing protein [Nitrospirae bacterium]|nr:methyltransferase domain-containing protein [Nitrospirota bacterium]